MATRRKRPRRCRTAALALGAALIGEDGVRDVTTAVDIGSKSWQIEEFDLIGGKLAT